MTDEELDRLLAPTPASGNAAAIRRSALAASLAALPRGHWRFARIAAGMALLTIGFALGWAAKPQPDPLPPERIEVPAVEAAPKPVEPPSEAKPVELYTAEDLDKLETQAEIADPATAAKLYRQVGDIYLSRTDIAAATRCYRLCLNALGRDGLATQNDDSWLLISMKSSTRREMER